jgi:catechol 2,3-dioxygenase-like lactoylglutathione lyase family enzyme
MLDIFKKPVEKTHVNPRYRAYGKARIDIARRAASREDWDQLWKRSTFPFPFSWGESWKQCIEYKVNDFAAEVGFYIDIMGFPVNAFDPDYAMFTSPKGEFYFSVVPAAEGESATPPEAIRLQFMVDDILNLAAELERRGIKFEHWPQPCVGGSSLFIGYFRTPHGICIDLWGLVGDEFSVDGDEPVDDVDNRDGNMVLDESDLTLLAPPVPTPAIVQEPSVEVEDEQEIIDNETDKADEDVDDTLDEDAELTYEYIYEEDE